jgi:hypothetical protein
MKKLWSTLLGVTVVVLAGHVSAKPAPTPVFTYHLNIDDYYLDGRVDYDVFLLQDWDYLDFGPGDYYAIATAPHPALGGSFTFDAQYSWDAYVPYEPITTEPDGYRHSVTSVVWFDYPEQVYSANLSTSHRNTVLGGIHIGQPDPDSWYNDPDDGLLYAIVNRSGGLDDTHAVFQQQDIGGDFVVRVYAAVPETSTWAMMLIGVGALGAAMRARRTSRGYRSVS